jgi:hypothetical protein
MRTSIAYFAGAGTVVAAIGIGLGGGLVMGNIMSPHQPKQQMTKYEQQTSQPAQPTPADQPQPAQSQASTQTPVLNVAASQTVSGTATAPANPPQPQTQQVSSSPPPSASTEVTTAAAAKPADAAAKPAAQPSAQPVAPDPHDQASAPENAYAKAHEADLKRLDDKHRGDRHQQRTARRQRDQDPRYVDDQDQRNVDQDARDVDQQYRRDADRRGRDDRGTEVIVQRDDRYDRPMRVQRDNADDDNGPPRSGPPIGLFPHINLFGPND